MGLRKQRQIKMKQAIKRTAKRKRLAAKGVNLADVYYGKFCLKTNT